jgi:hypothetical protein
LGLGASEAIRRLVSEPARLCRSAYARSQGIPAEPPTGLVLRAQPGYAPAVGGRRMLAAIGEIGIVGIVVIVPCS